MAPHSSTLAWKIPWAEEPGRLQSMGSLRVGHDWATSLSLFTFLHWRRKWQSTPVFLPGESQGWGSLVGCCLWGRTESDKTEATWQWQQSREIFKYNTIPGATPVASHLINLGWGWRVQTLSLLPQSPGIFKNISARVENHWLVPLRFVPNGILPRK